MKIKCLGVLRELTNSPNRETDDALILKSVLAELESSGFAVTLASPEQFDSAYLEGYDLIIPMCEQYGRLRRLMTLSGPKPAIINHPSTVLDCYRTSMVPILSKAAQVRFPESEIRKVADGAGEPPAFDAPQGWWLKRGDVHNTCDHDVVRINDWRDMKPALADFRAREITHCVIQPHIPGDLIKFYGVGPGRWFTWFYHNAYEAQGLPFDTEDLEIAAGAAASAVGLEIFGGDAIISSGKVITIIDINSWPSFARVRGGAAPQIARHLRSRALNLASPASRRGRIASDRSSL